MAHALPFVLSCSLSSLFSGSCMVASFIVASSIGFTVTGVVLVGGVTATPRVKLNADPNEGVGTVNADVVVERVPETCGSEGDGVDQPGTAGEREPGIVEGDGSINEAALTGKLVDGSSPERRSFEDDDACLSVWSL